MSFHYFLWKAAFQINELFHLHETYHLCKRLPEYYSISSFRHPIHYTSSIPNSIFFNIFFLTIFAYLFIYLWLCWVFVSVRGLSPVAASGGHSSSRRTRPLTIVASLVAEHRLQMCRLSSCGSRAQLLRGMWDLPRPGLEPVTPALAGRFSTTAPPGKPP